MHSTNEYDLVQRGDLVLAIWAPIIIDKKKGKQKPNWEGYFVIDKIYSNRTYLLRTIAGDRIIPHKKRPIPKKYYL